MRVSFLLTTALLVSCSAPHSPDEGAIPLNLAFGVPGLVAEDVPWGWSFQSSAWVGVEVRADPVSAELRFHRDKEGADGEVFYDLASPFPDQRFVFGGSVRRDEGAAASLRIGVRVLDEGWELTESFSDWSEGGEVEAELRTPENSYNVQLVAQYRGTDAARLGSLRLSIDGSPAGETLPGQLAPDPALVEWARDRAVVLRTTNPTEPLDDLEALQPLIGDSKLILLGESTHGSAEFFELKARVVKWLASKGEPTVFVIEDHPDKADRIDRFIQTGLGDATSAVEGLFGFWSRREVVELVRWMREETAAERIRVTFAGVDLQVPLGPISRLEVESRELDAELGEEVAELLRPMRDAWEESRYPQREPEEYRRWAAAAGEVRDVLRVGGASARTLFDARLVRQSAEVSGSGGDIRVRDRFLADNFVWLREHSPPGSRFVVWAHNTHIRRDEDAMGQHLAARYPEDLVSIGLFTHQGETIAFDGRTLRSYELFPGPADSLERTLHLTGHEVFALDLRGAPSALRKSLLHRNIGLWPADLGFYRADVPSGFDALLFVDTTTPTRPLVR